MPHSAFLMPIRQVLNFYELRENAHVKTLAVMEELESLIILKREHSDRLLASMGVKSSSSSSSASKAHVLVAAGERGVLRLFKLFIKVGISGPHHRTSHS